MSQFSTYHVADKPALVAYNNTLYLMWNRAGEEGIYTSTSTDQGLTWSPQKETNSFINTTKGPGFTITTDGKYHLVFRGTDSQETLYYSNSTDFQSWINPISLTTSTGGGVRSSDAPSLANYNNAVYLLWKGITGDNRIWYTKRDPTTQAWAPAIALPSNFTTSSGPAYVITQNGIQHLVYRNTDNSLRHSYRSNDTATWSTPTAIAGAFSTDRPALTIDETGTLQLLWKGSDNDTRLFFASCSLSGTNYVWTAISEILNPSLKSQSGPALAILATRHHLVYRSTDIASSLLYATRITNSGWQSVPRLTSRSSDRPAWGLSFSSYLLLYKGASDNSVWRSVGSALDNGKSWTDPVQINTTIQTKSGPSLAVSDTGLHHLVYQGLNNEVFHATSTDGETWGNISSSLGSCGDRPSVAVYGDTVFVAWKNAADNAIYLARSNNAGQSFNAAVSTGVTTSNGPALLYNGGERLHIAYRGTDGAVYYANRENATEPWDITQTDGLTSDTPVLQFYNGKLILFWKGVSGDPFFYYSVSTTQFKDWTPQMQLHKALKSDYSPAVLVRNGNAQIVFRATGTDGALHHTSGSLDINWLGSSKLGVNGFSTDSPTVGFYGGNVWIVFKGSQDQLVYYSISSTGGKTWAPVAVMKDGSPPQNCPLTDNTPVLVSWNRYGTDYFNVLYRSNSTSANQLKLAYGNLDQQIYSIETITGTLAASTDGPTAVPYKGKLFVFWKGTSNNDLVYFVTRTYGAPTDNPWGTVAQLPNTIMTTHRPVAVVSGSIMNLFYRGNDTYVRYARNSDGGSWSENNTLQYSTSTPPGATYYDGRLYLVWKSANSQSIWLSKSDENGYNWSQPTQVLDLTTDSGPSIAAVNGRLHLTIRGTDQAVTHAMAQDIINWNVVTPVGTSADPYLIEEEKAESQIETRLDETAIPVKICLNQEIHKLTTIPSTYESLLKIIGSIFGDRLSTKWMLSYIDLEGDNIMLSDENDFKALVEEFKKVSKTVRILILSKDNQLESDSYQVIDSDSSTQILIQTPKSAQVSQMGEISESRLDLVLRGKKIVKKLTKNDLAQDKREQFESELAQLLRDLTQDEVTLLENHREKWSKKQAQRKDELKSLLVSLINEQGQGLTKINENYSSQAVSQDETKKAVVQTTQLKKKYPSQVQEKAQMLKNIFGGASMEDLLDLVSKSSDAPLEQLVRNYVSH